MRDRTRVGGVAAEEVGMSADLSQVLPGWRGTDPDGGTWVRTPDPDDCPWHYMDQYGEAEEWRSQEEAEAAGLVAVVAETAVHELCEAIRLTAEYVGPKTLPAIDGWSWFDALVKYAPETAQVFSQAGWGHLSPAAVPAPLDPGAVSDADRVGDAETFLAHWAGGGRVSAEDREDFIAAWTGWHRGTDFDRECAERDAKEALDAYVSALAVERAELTAALADARVAAPAPLDPGNPEHAELVRNYLNRVPLGEWLPSDWPIAVGKALVEHRARLDREQREAEQDASERKRAEEIADRHGVIDIDGAMDLVLAGIRAERARQEAEEPGRICCCGAMRVPGGELSVTDTDTVHRVGGPCYVDEERAS